jgi:hypothetical protein
MLNHYMEAKGLEEQADRFLSDKKYREAAELFLKAAVLYEQSALGVFQER